ncbi:MAG: hypothetical protein AB1465_03180 [Patescibacteria group bacterium]
MAREFPSDFAREYHEKGEKGFERGKNVSMTVTFSRHEEPGKTPEGMSADFLTEKGIAAAYEKGKKIPNEYIMAVGSKSVERARQTGALELESATGPEGMANAVNVRMTPELEKMGHKKFAAGEYLIYRHGDLNPVRGLKDMWLEGGIRAKEAVEGGIIPANQKENYQYDYYFNNPARARELGAQTPREVAREMAHRANTCLKMSGRIYEGMDLDVRNYSHGPRLECLLKYVLRQPDGRLGFDKIEEIGGAFKPGESFDLDVQRDEKGELKSVPILRGEKELGTLDLKAIEQLVKEYKERKKSE